MMYDHSSWMGFGGIWMLLFWGLVILGVIAIVKYIWGAPDNEQARASTALQILEERYARGEIDSDQFRRQKRELHE